MEKNEILCCRGCIYHLFTEFDSDLAIVKEMKPGRLPPKRVHKDKHYCTGTKMGRMIWVNKKKANRPKWCPRVDS